MSYQNLFETITQICGYVPTTDDMMQIISAYEKDIKEQFDNLNVL